MSDENKAIKKLIKTITQELEHQWHLKIRFGSHELVEAIEALLQSFYEQDLPLYIEQLIQEPRPTSEPKKQFVQLAIRQATELSIVYVYQKINDKNTKKSSSEQVGQYTDSINKLRSLLADCEANVDAATTVKKRLWKGCDVTIDVGNTGYSVDGSKQLIILPNKLARRVSQVFHLLLDSSKADLDYMNKYQYFGEPAEAIGKTLQTTSEPVLFELVSTAINASLEVLYMFKRQLDKTNTSDRAILEQITNEALDYA
jgi:hypothetical protein